MNKYYDIQKRLETYFQELTDTSWLSRVGTMSESERNKIIDRKCGVTKEVISYLDQLVGEILKSQDKGESFKRINQILSQLDRTHLYSDYFYQTLILRLLVGDQKVNKAVNPFSSGNGPIYPFNNDYFP